MVVFDDINWSPGMTRAWTAIERDPRVEVSLDLHEAGIVAFDSTIEKRETKRVKLA